MTSVMKVPNNLVISGFNKDPMARMLILPSGHGQKALWTRRKPEVGMVLYMQWIVTDAACIHRQQKRWIRMSGNVTSIDEGLLQDPEFQA